MTPRAIHLLEIDFRAHGRRLRANLHFATDLHWSLHAVTSDGITYDVHRGASIEIVRPTAGGYLPMLRVVLGPLSLTAVAEKVGGAT